ncbi:putative FAD/NAD(P)-binding domain superfamily [Helianthus annuus]|nr:putative FAD/NAD(P)-binding domain superfamily [Helianthus annuus]
MLSLRITGFALTLWTNAWRALDAVGIGNTLRQTFTQMKGEGYESRCVRRKDLLETIVKELPSGTIRYSSKVAAINELSRFKLVHLADGSIIKTKVLIGCDGVNSVVAKWLGLETPVSVVSVGRSAIRGLVEFPDGSGFDPMLHVNFGGDVRFGFLPVDEKTVYWFCTFTPSQVPTCKPLKYEYEK